MSTVNKDGIIKVVEKEAVNDVKVDNLEQLIKADEKRRADAVNEGIQALLKEHRCSLTARVILTTRGNDFQIEVAPQK